MKKIFKNISFLLLAMTLVVACDDTGDDNTAGLAEGGVVIGMNGTGKMLGSPTDPSDLTAPVNLSDAQTELNLTVVVEDGYLPSTDISKYIVYKTLNSGTQIQIGESPTLPITITYSTIAEYLDGTGVAEADLRIGDIFNFEVKLQMNDGSILMQQAHYEVPVNCLSDLAGDYVINYSSGPEHHYVTELSPGLYEIDSMLGWPGNGYLVRFTDTCGTLQLVNDWQFASSYPMGGVGTVDANTGDITWTGVFVEGIYSDRTYTMIKQ